MHRIDDWRRKQEDLPSRAEAIRRLVELNRAERRDRNQKTFRFSDVAFHGLTSG
jgi:hypothetical protein